MAVFPVAPDIAGPELLSAARRSRAAAIITIGQSIPSAREAFTSASPFRELAADALLHTQPPWQTARDSEPALLLLSSGTTGQPKVVRRNGTALDAVASATADAI